MGNWAIKSMRECIQHSLHTKHSNVCWFMRMENRFHPHPHRCNQIIFSVLHFWNESRVPLFHRCVCIGCDDPIFCPSLSLSHSLTPYLPIRRIGILSIQGCTSIRFMFNQNLCHTIDSDWRAVRTAHYYPSINVILYRDECVFVRVFSPGYLPFIAIDSRAQCTMFKVRKHSTS